MISFIIPYRNREEHLRTLLPHLQMYMAGTPYEVIVVEQRDDLGFRRGTLFNIGAQHASGDILIFHDVDHIIRTGTYIPTHDNWDVFLPIERVEYVTTRIDSGTREFNSKPLEEIPPGYRHFKDGVDANFFGGITVIKKAAFEKINGFDPRLECWGNDDAILRERITHYGLRWKRSTDGLFYALDHADNGFKGHEPEFQHNLKATSEWNLHLNRGLTDNYSENVLKIHTYPTEKWIDVTFYPTELQPYSTIGDVRQLYNDAPDVHRDIWTNFKTLVNLHPHLKSHRDHIVANKHLGFGNRSLLWAHHLIFKEMPTKFKFLEIGIFCGQTLSLWSMMNKRHGKEGIIYGIGPLAKVDDKYSNFPALDYEHEVQQMYAHFGLDATDLVILQGLSQDQKILDMIRLEGPFDCIYIDGNHSYDVVCSDITHYKSMLKNGGYLIMDDASNDLKIPNGLIRMDWRGLPDVTKAVNELLDTDPQFTLVFAAGHNKIYQKRF